MTLVLPPPHLVRVSSTLLLLSSGILQMISQLPSFIFWYSEQYIVHCEGKILFGSRLDQVQERFWQIKYMFFAENHVIFSHSQKLAGIAIFTLLEG